MPLDALGAANGGLEDFRVTAPREIGVMLKQLCDGCVQVNLNASDGSVISATVWTMDATRGSLGFSVDANDPALQTLLECQEVVVVGYLESVKLQFDVHNLVLVHGSRGSVLNCGYRASCSAFSAAAPTGCGRCGATRRWRACATPKSPRCSWPCACLT